MEKVAQYLRNHILGEVTTAKDVLDYFSTDGSVLTLRPKVVVYPRRSSDIRKLTRFTWQLAEKGTSIPITARGRGTDQAGGAIGNGVMLAFPAHMNRLMEIGKDYVIVQPGINYRTLQDILHAHGRFLPPYPSSIDFSTIGGAVANNAGGQNTLKYGMTRDYVESLEVVLANGEIITTGRLSKRELNKKMGETSFEAEIYRQLDGLLSDNAEIIKDKQMQTSKNSAGYELASVKGKDGSLDLTPLFVGSQGTLGIITKVKLRTEVYNTDTQLILAYFDDMEKAGSAVKELKKLNPSTIELVDKHLLDFVHKTSPKQLGSLLEEPFPKIVLIIEFDDNSKTARNNKQKKARKLLQKYAFELIHTDDIHEQEIIWKLRHSAAAISSHDSENGAKALPIIEDGVVPDEKLTEFLDHIYDTFRKYNLETAVWGHAGNANLHTQPFLNLAKTEDRQKLFKIMDEYYGEVIKMGGSTSGEHSDGRLRAPYLKELFGEEMYSIFEKVKKIFDPYNTLNPNVITGVEKKDLAPMLRREYSMRHLYDHLPRT
jgi:FAD/FMN-containing dehydrogenase